MIPDQALCQMSSFLITDLGCQPLTPIILGNFALNSSGDRGSLCWQEAAWPEPGDQWETCICCKSSNHEANVMGTEWHRFWSLQVWQAVASNDVMLSLAQKEVTELWIVKYRSNDRECLMSVPRKPSFSIIPSAPNDSHRSKSYNCLIVTVFRWEVMISCPGLLLQDWFLISWLPLHCYCYCLWLYVVYYTQFKLILDYLKIWLNLVKPPLKVEHHILRNRNYLLMPHPPLRFACQNKWFKAEYWDALHSLKVANFSPPPIQAINNDEHKVITGSLFIASGLLRYKA